MSVWRTIFPSGLWYCFWTLDSSPAFAFGDTCVWCTMSNRSNETRGTRMEAVAIADVSLPVSVMPAPPPTCWQGLTIGDCR